MKVTLQDGQSLDIQQENIEALQQLFPELVRDGKVNFDVFRQVFGDLGVLEEGEEKFGLNWHGKKKARQNAFTPSLGTLLPCTEESVDWDTTQNLFIEGDNLEVLKLLQKSYANKVKMIYIDPPYNTGNDFVYKDNYVASLDSYLYYTDQKDDEGNKLISKQESDGRLHTKWLSMMYSRLLLSKNLLKSDGLIFISINDIEVAHLKMLCNEIFGQENFIANFVWKSRQNKDNRTINGASIDHEYVLCYGNKIRGENRNLSQYSNPDDDERGDWTSANMVGIATAERRPNLHYDLIDPETNINYGCPTMGWRYDRKSMAKLIEEKRILWPTNPDGRPRRKAFLNELESEFTGFSSLIGQDIYTRHGTADIMDLFGERVFDFPKPVDLLTKLIEQGTKDGDIVLDFFAGSGTTAHAVWRQMLSDNKKRRFILVQLPEYLNALNLEQKSARLFCEKNQLVPRISELTKARLKLAIEKEFKEVGRFDFGFKVLKLDKSNIQPWNVHTDDLENTLDLNEDHLIEGRTELDVLYELLLKRGIDLATPIEKREINSKTLYSIGYGAVFACLDDSILASDLDVITSAIIEWHKELAPSNDTHIFFKDSAFQDDVVKTNLAAILEQNGLKYVRSL